MGRCFERADEAARYGGAKRVDDAWWVVASGVGEWQDIPGPGLVNPDAIRFASTLGRVEMRAGESCLCLDSTHRRVYICFPRVVSSLSPFNMGARLRRLPLLIAAAALFGCDSPSDPGGSVPAEIVVVSGDLQTATVGTDPGAALVVRVTNSRGRPVSGHPVQFVVTAGGGTVAPPSVLTDADGVAQTRWTLGTVAGDTQRVEARANGAVIASFRAVARPDVPAAITPVGATAFTGAAGQVLLDSLAARVADRFGNPIPSAPVVWTVRAGGGAVSPVSGATDAQGVARAAWTLGARLDSVQVVEAAAGVSLATQFTATATVGVGVTVVKVRGDLQGGVVGAALADSLVVKVSLLDGSPVQGATVSWSAAGGTGLVTPATSTTGPNGEAAARWTLGTLAGVQSATATVAGLTPATFLATAAPGPAAVLQKVSGDGQVGSPGTRLADSLVVRAIDAHGTRCPARPCPGRW